MTPRTTATKTTTPKTGRLIRGVKAAEARAFLLAVLDKGNGRFDWPATVTRWTGHPGVDRKNLCRAVASLESKRLVRRVFAGDGSRKPRIGAVELVRGKGKGK